MAGSLAFALPPPAFDYSNIFITAIDPSLLLDFIVWQRFIPLADIDSKPPVIGVTKHAMASSLRNGSKHCILITGS